MSFIYEVNLEVNTQVAKQFAKWLTPHIEEMLSFDGFLSAQWLIESREELTKDIVLWTVQYTLRDKEAYTKYLSTHASRMRQEGLDLFGGSFQASRRLLDIHTSFKTQS